MRALLDTNVLVSGLLWHGPPHELLALARAGRLRLIGSPKLLAEFERVLSRPKFDPALVRSKSSRSTALAEIRALMEWWDPPALPKPVCRDPDDDAVLACALAARAELIVSGDDDLLALQRFEGIPILTAREALARIGISA